MLNRTAPTAARSETKRPQIRDHRNKVGSPLTTGSRSLLSKSSFLTNNTDAILLKAQNYLVSQLPRSTISSRLISSSSSTSPATLETQEPRITVPKLRSLKLRQISRHTNNSSINLMPKQPVNSKVNTIGKDNQQHCSIKKSSPKQVQAYKTMNHIYYIAALLLVLSALSYPTQFVNADAALTSAMQKLGISPKVISVDDDIKTIKVKLLGNVVKPGDPVPAKNFRDLNLNEITWEVSNSDARHALLLLDIDRTSPGTNNTQSIYNQFTSLNIPGNGIGAGLSIVAFDTPSVPCHPGTKHRILMLAFRQEQMIDIRDVADMWVSSGHSPKRENFKLNDFISRHRLRLVAANAFWASGESNGVCSGSSTIHSFSQSTSSILIPMVIAMAAYSFSSRRSLVK